MAHQADNTISKLVWPSPQLEHHFLLEAIVFEEFSAMQVYLFFQLMSQMQLA